jgi:putative ABC transport system ATP-binding protein
LSAILEASGLRKTYHRGAVDIEVLRGVSISVASGEFVSIVGRSGSGKSTLLNLLGGLDTPDAGTIVVRGRDITRATRRELALHRRKTVGMVFQSFNLIPSRTALENVTLALAFGEHPRADRARRAAEILTSVGLRERLDHTPGELSGGEAQRVAIARALANGPDILLADEPTGNLDSTTSQEIISLLSSLNAERGLTVLLVTHEEAIARPVSRRVLTLLDGRVVDEEVLTISAGAGDAP